MSEYGEPIRFAEMTPDRPDFENSLIDARNCIPIQDGYDSLQQLSIFTDQLPTRGIGAITAKDAVGDADTYAGTRTKLFHSVDGVWTDATRLVGGDYATAEDGRWEFEIVGTNIIGTNFIDEPQIIASGGINFADLTSDFKSKHIAQVRQFTVHGNTDDAVDGHVPFRIRWSAFDDPSDYTISPVTQSDFQDPQSPGGACQGIVGGEIGMVFMERSTHRMTYVSGALVFQFDEVDPGVGALAAGGIIQHGPIYFLSEDGFRITTGGLSVQIGEEKIDRTVLADLDTAFLERITSAVDVDTGLIYWAYPGAQNLDGTPNKLAIYNPAIQRWTFGDEAVEVLFSAATDSASIERVGALFATVEDIPGSLDDKVFKGGAFQVGAITKAGEASLFTGPARDTLFITGEFQAADGSSTFIGGIRPLISGLGIASIQARIGTRANLNEPVSFTGFNGQNSEGLIPFRKRGRYLRSEFRTTGQFIHAVGFQVLRGEAGARE